MASAETNITIKEAQDCFLEIAKKLNNEENFKKLLSWIEMNWLNACETDYIKSTEGALCRIAADVREQLPMQAVLPSEQIFTPAMGENSDCDPRHTVHVDAFLYDDNLIDDMVEEGKMSRNYCLNCGSHSTKPLIFISHSASRERLAYFFKALLPPLDGKLIVDVGSRLGAVLYGAYVYTSAAKIVGIEMKRDFCRLQENIIQKYNLQDRIEVVEANVMNRPDMVQAADVIILHNAFEFFLCTQDQIAVWRFLRENVKSGAILVTVPPLETTMASLPVGIDLASWVRELPLFNPDAAGISDWESEMAQVKHYMVL